MVVVGQPQHDLCGKKAEDGSLLGRKERPAKMYEYCTLSYSDSTKEGEGAMDRWCDVSVFHAAVDVKVMIILTYGIPGTGSCFLAPSLSPSLFNVRLTRRSRPAEGRSDGPQTLTHTVHTIQNYQKYQYLNWSFQGY